jgi:hypothetical protein
MHVHKCAYAPAFAPLQPKGFGSLLLQIEAL